MIRVFVRDAVAIDGLDDAIPIEAGTRATVLTMEPNTEGCIRFTVGSDSLEMPATSFTKVTKDRD